MWANRAPSLSLTTGGAKAKITPFWFAVDKTQEDVVCVCVCGMGQRPNVNSHHKNYVAFHQNIILQDKIVA